MPRVRSNPRVRGEKVTRLTQAVRVRPLKREGHRPNEEYSARNAQSTVVSRILRPWRFLTGNAAFFVFIPTRVKNKQERTEEKMNVKLLKLLEKNARMDNKALAALLGISEEEVAREISEMQTSGIIKGYKCVIDWEKVDNASVSAIIELKVVPKAGLGFEEVAERIAKYPEVESVSLMSGACDLTVTVTGSTFRDVSDFVAKELAVIDGVTSTATQFIMRRYKEFGIELFSTEDDGRSKVSL